MELYDYISKLRVLRTTRKTKDEIQKSVPRTWREADMLNLRFSSWLQWHASLLKNSAIIENFSGFQLARMSITLL